MPRSNSSSTPWPSRPVVGRPLGRNRADGIVHGVGGSVRFLYRGRNRARLIAGLSQASPTAARLRTRIAAATSPPECPPSWRSAADFSPAAFVARIFAPAKSALQSRHEPASGDRQQKLLVVVVPAVACHEGGRDRVRGNGHFAGSEGFQGAGDGGQRCRQSPGADRRRDPGLGVASRSSNISPKNFPRRRYGRKTPPPVLTRARLRPRCTPDFMPLRRLLPMNVWRPVKPRALDDGSKIDAARIDAIWSDCRARFAAGGPISVRRLRRCRRHVWRRSSGVSTPMPSR